MTMSARVTLATLVLLGSGIVLKMVAADEPAAGAGIDAKTAFNRIKSLEGEWKNPGSGKHADSKSVFKVTAAGSAVMEMQHCDSHHEMVTMYHLDGKDLKATHYCAAGNQPRFKLDLKNSKPDFYSFIFDGGTNLNPDKDMHIHAFRLTFLEGGKIDAEWDAYIDGKKSDTVKFPMARP